MLQVNPFFRPSARQLMKHQVFNHIREELDNKVVISPHKLKLKIDEKEFRINYHDSDYRTDLKNTLLKTLVKECLKISPCQKPIKIMYEAQKEQNINLDSEQILEKDEDA